ncbi:cyclic nucleotide-binding domain protein (macronuclear) [Tetrahymena thermophila SB210]|uniref:Cyclic nucleotide-binding domain protein n=1 Tax=Tetrahymena thermophila (strain SB210) TaxID=312017 RepID=Q24BV8_TETTS|nr:cyclic nucleotide-binding domain protein [Tetrahymena thermophila SB210]EAS05279.2 cyclic nucleotide-binding domain protein [Tetrahymena thermophila SB210]|eukprot:XP_001025524.2 cyclic nucleotide-binding domain protein [Tetrahymena thermophila SB210]
MNLDVSPQLGSFERADSKDPEDYFKQYRIQFNQSQMNIDSIHKIKFKKAEEEEQVAQNEPMSLLQIQFDKIAISPIQNSRNSNISESNRNIQSDSNPMKHLGPYSNNMGSDQLNELHLGVGSSHLNPPSKFNNKSIDFDYYSSNQGTHQIIAQQSNKTITIKDKQDDEESKDNQDKYISMQKIAFDKKSFKNQDYDELYDYNYTDREDNLTLKQEPNSIREMLRQSLKRMFNLLKIESATIQHEVQLNEEQYRLINDLASDVTVASDEKSKTFLFKIIKSICFITRLPTLNPSHTLSLIWDAALIIFYFLAFILLSIQVFLNSGIYNEQNIINNSWMRPTLIVVLLQDIFKNLITGYYCKGKYQSDLNYIIYRYVKWYFIFDLIPFIPLVAQAEEYLNFGIKLAFSILYLFKIVSVRLCLERIRLSWNVTNTNYVKRQFIKLLICYILFIHFFGIIYHGLSLIEIDQDYDSENSWLKRQNLYPNTSNNHIQYPSVWTRYLQSLLQAALILSSQSSQIPQTRLEQLFSIIASFFSLILFAYFFNELYISFKKIDKEDQSLLEEKRHVSHYMQQMNVSGSIRGRVANYLEYLHEKKANIKALHSTELVLKKLPNDLKSDLIYSTKSYFVPYFQPMLKKFSKSTINNIYKIIEEHSYQPGEIIFQEGDQSQPSLYAIISGKAELYLSGSQILNSLQSQQISSNRSSQQKSLKVHAVNPSKTYTRLALLKSRDCFGDISFFTSLPPSASARCTEFCTIVKIDRQKFIDLLNELNLEEDFEMMCMLRDEIIFKKNYRCINARCWCCQKFGHLANYCKLTHFYPLKSRIIQTRTSNYKQQRQQFFDRKKQTKKYSFLTITQRQTKFHEDYAEEISNYIEKYYPGQSNHSDYLPSSQSATSANQQSSNTEILSDKVEYEQHMHGGPGSNLDLPQPFNSNFKPSNTLNESSMIRQAGSSKVKHKDSTDSADMMLKEIKDSKGRKDSAQTKNSNDSFIKHKNTNRSSNKKDSPVENIQKIEQLADSSNKRKESSDSSFSKPESLIRDKTLKSQKTRGTQKTNKTNKSGSSLYRSKFEHSVPTQRMDSRASFASITTPPPKVSTPQQNISQDNTKILVTTSATKQNLKNNPQAPVIAVPNAPENPESQQDLSYELVLPKIELVLTNNNIPKQPLIDNSPDHNTNFSSMNLDQQSYYSKSESNLIPGISSLYVESQHRHFVQGSLLEFDCMKNFKVYNTKSNPSNVLEAPSLPINLHKRQSKKKVTIIAS